MNERKKNSKPEKVDYYILDLDNDTFEEAYNGCLTVNPKTDWRDSELNHIQIKDILRIQNTTICLEEIITKRRIYAQVEDFLSVNKIHYLYETDWYIGLKNIFVENMHLGQDQDNQSLMDMSIILKGYELNPEIIDFLKMLNISYQMKGTWLWLKVDIDKNPEYLKLDGVIKKLDY